jgi:hypothetical protein
MIGCEILNCLGLTHEPDFELHVVGFKLDRTTGTDRMSICARAHMLLRSKLCDFNCG